MNLSLSKDMENIYAHTPGRGEGIAVPHIFFFILHCFSETFNWFQINEPSVRDNLALSYRAWSTLSAAEK